MNLAARAQSANLLDGAATQGFNTSSILERAATVNSGFSSQGLLIQLRSHHPAGCLLSELLQVVDGQYIVRATVEVDGVPIASAMSAATTIDVAEDQARARVVAVVGLTPLNLVEPKVEKTATRIPDVAPVVTPVVEPDPVVVPAPELEEAPAPTVSKSTKSKSTKSKAKTTRSKAKASAQAEVPPPPEPVVEPAVEITGGEAASDELEVEYEFTMDGEPLDPAALDDDVPPPEPTIDLSDAIAQIGTEIERIGWTKKQGSAYLQETYGKRTRAELTETELLDFLHYLKALPSKVQPSLNDLPF